MEYPESAISVSSNINGIKDIKAFFYGAVARQIASKAFTRLSKPEFRVKLFKNPEYELASQFVANYLRENRMEVTLNTSNKETDGAIPKTGLPCNLWKPLLLSPEGPIFPKLVYECRPNVAEKIFGKSLGRKSHTHNHSHSSKSHHTHSHSHSHTHAHSKREIEEKDVEVVINFKGPVEKMSDKKNYQPVGGCLRKESIESRLRNALRSNGSKPAKFQSSYDLDVFDEVYGGKKRSNKPEVQEAAVHFEIAEEPVVEQKDTKPVEKPTENPVEKPAEKPAPEPVPQDDKKIETPKNSVTEFEEEEEEEEEEVNDDKAKVPIEINSDDEIILDDEEEEEEEEEEDYVVDE